MGGVAGLSAAWTADPQWWRKALLHGRPHDEAPRFVFIPLTDMAGYTRLCEFDTSELPVIAGPLICDGWDFGGDA